MPQFQNARAVMREQCLGDVSIQVFLKHRRLLWTNNDEQQVVH